MSYPNTLYLGLFLLEFQNKNWVLKLLLQNRCVTNMTVYVGGGPDYAVISCMEREAA